MQLLMLSAGITDVALITQIENRLKQSFGTPNVRTIAQLHAPNGNPPDDEAVRHVVMRSDVVLVIIAGHSLNVLAQPGTPDYLALRIGLENEHIRVIPALLHDTTMLKRATLPPAVQALASLNAVMIRENPHFEPDMTVLVDQVNKVAVGQISGVRAMFHVETIADTPAPVQASRLSPLLIGIGVSVLIAIVIIILLNTG